LFDMMTNLLTLHCVVEKLHLLQFCWKDFPPNILLQVYVHITFILDFGAPFVVDYRQSAGSLDHCEAHQRFAVCGPYLPKCGDEAPWLLRPTRSGKCKPVTRRQLRTIADAGIYGLRLQRTRYAATGYPCSQGVPELLQESPTQG
jgi:hypothetical protein